MNKKNTNKNKQEEEEEEQEAVKGERRTIDASVDQWACVLFSLSFVCREWQAGSSESSTHTSQDVDGIY